MRRAQSYFRVGVYQPLVALLHRRWDVLCLTSRLGTAGSTTVEALVDQQSETIRIYGVQRVAFDYIPPSSSDFRGRIFR